MVITSVKSGKKSSILVYIDKEILINVPREIFLKSQLNVGEILDEEDVEKLKFDIKVYDAQKKALNLLSYRAHTKHELFEKIKMKVDENAAKEATDKMEKIGLINDEKFAFDYVEYLSRTKLYGVRRIQFELKRKGISPEIISKVMNSSKIDEDASINKIINKKIIRDEKDKKRLIAYLQRFGYEWDKINAAVEHINPGN